jgi:hypothetical protein
MNSFAEHFCDDEDKSCPLRPPPKRRYIIEKPMAANMGANESASIG